MAEEVKEVLEQTPAQKTKVEEVKPTEVDPVIDPKAARQEVLRDLSKELGVNLFEAEGLQQVKELIDSQKSEQEKLQEKLKAYEEEKATWQKQELNYKTKLKASELGIHNDHIEDALKLAEFNPDKLVEVVKKYPMFKTKEGITIGVQNPTGTKPPTNNTEAEAYMANDPRYKKWLKTQK